MNTAVYASGILPAPLESFSTIVYKHWLMALLIAGVLFSAFSVIYVENINRNLISSLQNSQETRNNLDMQWSQLLLEQSALSSRIRVADVAKQKLHMVIPGQRKIISINKIKN